MQVRARVLVRNVALGAKVGLVDVLGQTRHEVQCTARRDVLLEGKGLQEVRVVRSEPLRKVLVGREVLELELRLLHPSSEPPRRSLLGEDVSLDELRETHVDRRVVCAIDDVVLLRFAHVLHELAEDPRLLEVVVAVLHNDGETHAPERLKPREARCVKRRSLRGGQSFKALMQTLSLCTAHQNDRSHVRLHNRLCARSLGQESWLGLLLAPLQSALHTQLEQRSLHLCLDSASALVLGAVVLASLASTQLPADGACPLAVDVQLLLSSTLVDTSGANLRSAQADDDVVLRCAATMARCAQLHTRLLRHERVVQSEVLLAQLVVVDGPVSVCDRISAAVARDALANEGNILLLL